ncbi:MAG: cytochrome c biogenesis protein CcsA [Bacteroidota bacterium]
MDIQYVGEHLFPGYLGRFFLLVGFALALISSFFYFQSVRSAKGEDKRWANWGKITFYVHGLAVILASSILMYLLLNRYYEYKYVWVHVENDLGLGYMIASFWAGQEGSFLFWTLCQVIVGFFLIRYAGEWEKPVMSVVGLSQVFMMSMMLGIHWGSTQIGVSPFSLLREVPANAANEFFQNPNYLSAITDGNGLNPLLRNFWMMSHPPVLFIGFALALVPFAYAIAGLWKKQFLNWIPSALPWLHLALLFLGAGILLGGVWAYESLTFGGFWAWDPIENASLVPWLIMVAALHLLLVAKRKQENIFPAFLFTFLSFVFVIYSTYLTRSGVLSETSVHSFGSDGMGGHILVYLFTFLIISLVLLFRRYTNLPSRENDQPMSRQFWLFIASMVLVLSAFQIIFTTSIPVINSVAGSELSPPVNVIEHYNTWQMPFAIAVALLMGFSHFLKWGKPNVKKSSRRLSLSLILALVFTVFIKWAGTYDLAQTLFLFAGLFAFFSSLDMLFRFRNILVNTPTIVSHLGIALFFIAILLTFSQQQTISKNTSGFFLGEDFPENENLLLIKDSILPMGDYFVTYKGNFRQGEDLFYNIDFLKKNKEDEYYKVFTSQPSIKLNETMGNVYNPHAKIYLDKDIFTYITFADIENAGLPREPSLLNTLEMTRGDTLIMDNRKMVLSNLEADNENMEHGEMKVSALIDVITPDGKTYSAKPEFILEDMTVHFHDDTIEELEYLFRFKEVSDKPYTIVAEVYEYFPEFIIVKTVIFPYINLLWLSCLVMIIGFYLAFRRRWKRRNTIASEKIGD